MNDLTLPKAIKGISLSNVIERYNEQAILICIYKYVPHIKNKHL